MNRTNFKSQTIELSMKDFGLKIVSHWKALLIICLLIASLLCYVQYLKEYRLYLNQLSQSQGSDKTTSPLSLSDEKENILSGLSTSDRNAVESVLNQREWIQNWSTYLKESIYMNLDPYKVKTLRLGFLVSDVEDEQMRLALCTSYLSYINDEATIASLRNLISPDCDTKYIRELISSNILNSQSETNNGKSTFKTSESSIIQLEVSVPDKVETDKLENVIKNALDSRTKDLSSTYSGHRLTTLYSNTVFVVNKNMVNSKNESINWLYNLQTWFDNSLASLNETQHAAYTAIIETQASADSSSQAKVSEPRFNANYFILGLALGFILYIFILASFQILSGFIPSGSAAETLTGARVLGSYYYHLPSTRIKEFLFHSKWANFLLKDKTNLSHTVDCISKSLNAYCRRFNINQIAILDLSSNLEQLKKITKAVSDNMLDVSLCVVNAENSELLIAGNNRLVLAIDNHTKILKAKEIVQLCNQYDVEIIGIIYCHLY